MFLKNRNFFNTEPEPYVGNKEKKEEQNDKRENERYAVSYSIKDEKLKKNIEAIENYCKEAGRKDLTEQLELLKEYLEISKFQVAVVGEFNRGKSTLVNRFIEKNIIPVSAIPATFMPIRVSGSKKEMLTLKSGANEKNFPLNAAAWDNIENQKKIKSKVQPEILLKVNCGWLLENDLEIMDTPGINSMIDDDWKMTDYALQTCDCAIVAIAAQQPFSETEKMFIMERILLKKIPRIMVVLTKLDIMPEKDRSNIVEYIQKQLEEFNADIPVYLSGENQVKGFEEYSGVNAIKGQILSWLLESDHEKLKKRKAYQLLRDICRDLTDVYQCQLDIMEEKEADKREAAEKKKSLLLQNAAIEWDNIEIEMLKKCNQNFDVLRKMTEERQEYIIEKLLMEIYHTGNPKDWWEKDYPYRIKMEMLSLGSSIENNLQSFYIRDMNWLNSVLKERYGTVIPPQSEKIADKSDFRNFMICGNVRVEDIRRSRIISRVGTGAVTVAGYFIFGMMGLSPVGMAIGIGGGIVSELSMHKRVEEQKAKLSKVIKEELPEVFSSSISTVEESMRNIYMSTIDDMKKACKEWAEAKCEAIDAVNKTEANTEDEIRIKEKIASLRNIEKYVNESNEKI